MDYRDEEYLKLFKQINEQNKTQQRDEFQMLRETPNYNNYYKNQNLNEVQINNYSQNHNLNEFNIETKVNGQVVNNQPQYQNLNEVKKQQKEDRLNEVMEKLKLERLNEIKKQEEERLKQEEINKLNESVNFKDSNVVSVEMFNKARYNAMMLIAKKI